MKYGQLGVPAEIKAVLDHNKGALAAIASASFMVNILMLAGPIFMLQVYDRVLPSRSMSTLVGLLLIVAVIFVFQSIVEAIRNRLLSRVSQAFDENTRLRVFEVVQRQSLTRPQADSLQMVRDLETLRSFIGGAGLIAICDLPWTPVYILVCGLFHPLMGLAVFAGVVGLCAITLATEYATRRSTRALVGLGNARRTTAETAQRHAETIHALGMTGRMRRLWSNRTSAYLEAQNESSDLTSGFGSAARFLRMILQSGVLAIGAYLTIEHLATAGVMLAATILSIRALSPIELAIANWRNFIAARDSLHRLAEGLADVPPAADPTTLPAPKHALQVTSVSVTAPVSGAVLLHDITFALEAGQAVAVIGPSGSGKSTLSRALIGAWAPARGVIRIDGASLQYWDSDKLGAHLGYLPQDVALFRGSVVDNISRFAENPDSQKLLAAATAAGVHEMILRLPQGYETEVGEGGAALSGGQRQRIALARALYDDPFLVVLDEPNSNLDAEGEKALAKTILAVRARKGIVVVVTHRPAILGVVDHILVLNEGRMQSFGKAQAILPELGSVKPAHEASAPRVTRNTRRKRLDAAE